MIKTTTLMTQLQEGVYDQMLCSLYVDEGLLDAQRERYVNAIRQYQALYGDDDVAIYSAAGRSEVSGNHTDHQRGCVLAASINLDAIAVVSPNDTCIKVVSDSYDIPPVFLSDLRKKEEEEGTSAALIRGVAARIRDLGYKVGGFTAFITSDVLVGCGLSSSAAFEDLIGVIIDGLYNDMAIDMVTIAQIGQYAENVYFGKPCGLMDQCACAVGGLIAIDFENPEKPIVRHVDVDFSTFHHSLCIVDTKGSHEYLTGEYAAIPAEMKKVAAYFGKDYLREVTETAFMADFAGARKNCGDRAVLRAFHFFKENKRVSQLVAALEQHDFEAFKMYVKASGDSSFKYLQNVYPASHSYNQAVSIALALSEDLLGTKGVCRVHGGGFAGTIQAFVSDDYVDVYKRDIEKVFGEDACHVLKIRPYGGLKVID